MCYNARYLIQKALKRAKHYNVTDDVNLYEKKLKDYDEWYRVSGFAHPKVIIYTNFEPYEPIISQWGFISSKAKGVDEKELINKSHLIARGETIFKKYSFIDSAKNRRCIIPADGFYEYHDYKRRKYPFYIFRNDREVIYFDGLWSIWKNPITGNIVNSYCIITTRPNNLLTKIHNKPQFGEPRMPVILEGDSIDVWLSENHEEELQKLLKPFPDEWMKAHTVKPLSGKNSPGNVPDANEYFEYEELAF